MALPLGSGSSMRIDFTPLLERLRMQLAANQFGAQLQEQQAARTQDYDLSKLKLNTQMQQFDRSLAEQRTGREQQAQLGREQIESRQQSTWGGKERAEVEYLQDAIAQAEAFAAADFIDPSTRAEKRAEAQRYRKRLEEKFGITWDEPEQPGLPPDRPEDAGRLPYEDTLGPLAPKPGYTKPVGGESVTPPTESPSDDTAEAPAPSGGKDMSAPDRDAWMALNLSAQEMSAAFAVANAVAAGQGGNKELFATRGVDELYAWWVNSGMKGKPSELVTGSLSLK